MEDKLDRAIFLKAQIKDLEYFIDTVTEFDENFNGKKTVELFLKKEVDIRVSFFGSRFFGCGTHKQSITVPDSVRNTVITESKKILNKYKIEFENLFNKQAK